MSAIVLERPIREKLQSLGFKTIVSLGAATRIETNKLVSAAENCKKDYPYHSWREPKRSGKGSRLIEEPLGELKNIQGRLNRLFQKLVLPDIFHGCYEGTHVKTNASPHLRAKQLEQIDLTNYYYNIHYSQVYGAFRELGCSPDVARLLTRLTTIKGHVPQGAPTSPIVAVVALLDASRRIGELCRQIDAKITIYGDNICISGPPHVKHYGKTFLNIVRQSGFKSRSGKRSSVSRSEIWQLPGLEVRQGRVDVPTEEFHELRDLLDRCIKEGPDGLGKHVCPRFRTKVSGRIYHYTWIGTGRAGKITARAQCLTRLWQRVLWPSKFNRIGCDTKKCTCDVD
ncbi:MAG TPA: reverse transcriptase family protein [Phycisphaerae bacterium]|nr:reverse transcriptase family protein [Phycisphaerae bacterium]